MTRLPLPTALALACAALVALPAHAVGRLADVNLIDRDSGARLPVYRHNGEWWVAGRPGARYAIEVRNPGGARLLGVMAVDGVNILSGETAGWTQTGYVLAPRQTAQITGWRKSDAEVATFHFTALPLSYAARTGRPDNVGVIGVALFRERAAPPPLPTPRPLPRSESPAAAGARAETAENDSLPTRRLPQAAPQLGTGHGAREDSWVGRTHFERRRSQPDEIVTLRYDSRENLMALGIIAAQPAPGERPQPFPESTGPGHVPDPPAWR